jgi:hypothetical protein
MTNIFRLIAGKHRRQPFPLQCVSAAFRVGSVPIIMMVSATGCTHYGVSGPTDLGLAARFDPQNLPTTLTSGDPNPKVSRNQVLSQWLIRSDYLCSDYLLQLSRSIRDTRLATDFLATVLSGLATILSQPAVTRPLAGSATIALGVGGDIQSDLFLQQAGDVVSTAIQAVRTRARAELQKKFAAEYADYTLDQGLADVQRYDRETCNLNVGLNEIRALLNVIGPAAPQANSPIAPLPPGTAEAGGGPSLEGRAPGTTTPMATTIIPPTVQNTPGGGLVLTPGKVVTTPAAGPPPGTGAAPPPPPTRPPGPPTPLSSTGTPQPAISNPIIAGGAIPKDVAERRSKLIHEIRVLAARASQDSAAKDKLDQVALVLGIQPSRDITRERVGIVVAVEAFVSSPQQARQQMDALSKLLNDVLTPASPF